MFGVPNLNLDNKFSPLLERGRRPHSLVSFDVLSMSDFPERSVGLFLLFLLPVSLSTGRGLRPNWARSLKGIFMQPSVSIRVAEAAKRPFKLAAMGRKGCRTRAVSFYKCHPASGRCVWQGEPSRCLTACRESSSKGQYTS